MPGTSATRGCRASASSCLVLGGAPRIGRPRGTDPRHLLALRHGRRRPEDVLGDPAEVAVGDVDGSFTALRGSGPLLHLPDYEEYSRNPVDRQTDLPQTRTWT